MLMHTLQPTPERARQIFRLRETRILSFTTLAPPPIILARRQRFVLRMKKLPSEMATDPSGKKTGRFLLTKEIPRAIV